MSKYRDYKIFVEATSFSEHSIIDRIALLEKDVREMIDGGWQPLGSLQIVHTPKGLYIFQSVVKSEG